MSSSSPAQITCAKCNKQETEDRSRWPSNICSKCLSTGATCTRVRPTGRMPRTRTVPSYKPYDKSVVERTKPTTATCHEKIAGSDLDPTIPHGLDYCLTCRREVCHSCGHESYSIIDRCMQCGGSYAFCKKCASERRGPKCLPQPKRVPPIAFDPVKFTPMSLSLTSCSSDDTKRPYFFGAKTVKEGDITRREAVVYAQQLFAKLVKFDATFTGERTDDLGLPNSQHTLAIGLLAQKDQFRYILTYSHYDFTHTSTDLRNHETFGALMIQADPLVFYDKSDKAHWLYDCQTPKTFDALPRAGGKPPAQYPGYECCGRYAQKDKNFHHAEVRASIFARKREYDIVYLAPTKECCLKCQVSLTQLKWLDRVPPMLQTNSDSSRCNFPLDEFAKKLQLPSTTLTITTVPGGGNCLFHALLIRGRWNNVTTHGALRTYAAQQISARDTAAAARIGKDGAPVDTQDLRAIADALGITIRLYEAYYGFGYAHRQTDHGSGQTVIPILIRSVFGQPDAHYDAL